MKDGLQYWEIMVFGATAALVLMLIGFRKYVKEDIWQSKKFRLSGGVLLIAAGVLMNIICIGGMAYRYRCDLTVFSSRQIVQSEYSVYESGDLIEVPNVTGMEQYEAVSVLMNRGLNFQVWWQEENDVNAVRRYIAEQSIPAGSRVPKGMLVGLELYVKEEDKLGDGEVPSEAPSVFEWYNIDSQQGVQVPNVVGMEQTQATELLVGCGLNFQVWWTGAEDEVADEYYVAHQSVPAGSCVPAGTKIDLWLSVNKYEK